MGFGGEGGRPLCHYTAMKVSPLGLTALNRGDGFKSPQDLKSDFLEVARPRLAAQLAKMENLAIRILPLLRVSL